MKLIYVVFLGLLSSTSKAAIGTLYKCTTEGTNIQVILDFEARTVELFSPIRRRVTASDQMRDVRSDYVGESLYLMYSAKIAGVGEAIGRVSLEETSPSQAIGALAGNLTFGDVWNLNCTKLRYSY